MVLSAAQLVLDWYIQALYINNIIKWACFPQTYAKEWKGKTVSKSGVKILSQTICEGAKAH